MIADFDTDGRLVEVIYCHIFKSEVPFDQNWAVDEDCHIWARNPQSLRFVLKPTLLLPEDEIVE